MFKMRQDNWDSAFNLTTSYRIDSDIPRPFGNLQKSLADARYYHLDHVDPVTGDVSKEWIARDDGLMSEPSNCSQFDYEPEDVPSYVTSVLLIAI